MKNFCVNLIKFYRSSISPLKPQCCRFTPTCSEYALQAFSKHGFFCGCALTLYRILRCSPLCRPGYDPVPEKIFTGRCGAADCRPRKQKNLKKFIEKNELN